MPPRDVLRNMVFINVHISNNLSTNILKSINVFNAFTYLFIVDKESKSLVFVLE